MLLTIFFGLFDGLQKENKIQDLVLRNYPFFDCCHLSEQPWKVVNASIWGRDFYNGLSDNHG